MQASEQSGSTTRGAYSRARPRSSQSPAPSTSQGAPTPHGISAIELVTSYSDSNIRSETPPEELTPAAPSVVYANEVFQAGRPHNRKMLRTRTSSTQTIDSDGGVAQPDRARSQEREALAAAEPDVEFKQSIVDTRCGCLSIRPKCLQPLCKPSVMLVDLSWIALTQSFIVNGCINVVLPTLERRFQLKSIESGMIIASYNFANCIAIIPVAFFGTTRNKPVFVAGGAAVMGTGAFIFSLSHFIAPAYQYGKDIQDLCPAGPLPEDLCTGGDIRNYRFLLMLGHAMHGVGTTPFYTLGVTYLDENVPTKQISTYLGIYTAMAVLGPGIGFLTAGTFLARYVDITKDVSGLGLTSASAVWVGAWWVGFVIAAIMSFAAVIPTLCFPKHLPSYYDLLEEKKAEAIKKGQTDTKKLGAHGLQQSLGRLLTNPPFICLALAGTSESMLTSAVTAFATKFLESQFAISSTYAAGILGFLAITGGCGGTFLGGYVVTRFNMRCESIIKMCMMLSFIPFVCIFMFRMYCDDPKFAVNLPLVGNDSHRFTFPCNKHCDCRMDILNPVCSTDGTVFFSPCFAGCETALTKGGAGMYHNCSCLTNEKLVKVKDGSEHVMQAERKKCRTGCRLLPFFVLSIFLALFSTFFNTAPLVSSLLRVVDPKDRSLALALKWISVRAFGTIPAPLFFGKVIDRSCLVWQRLCGRSGSCLYYNNRLLSHNLFMVLILIKTASIFLYFLSLEVYKARYRSAHSRARI